MPEAATVEVSRHLIESGVHNVLGLAISQAICEGGFGPNDNYRVLVTVVPDTSARGMPRQPHPGSVERRGQ